MLKYMPTGDGRQPLGRRRVRSRPRNLSLKSIRRGVFQASVGDNSNFWTRTQ